jgi:Domain of unknown function (DUF4332)
MASYPIGRVPSIGPFYANKLKAARIKSTARLLQRASTPKLRKELAAHTNIPMSLIVDWANIADLTRVPGIALDYADLLTAAGVNTVKDLGRRNSENLVARMAEINAEQQRVDLLPSKKRVDRWIETARALDPGLDY